MASQMMRNSNKLLREGGLFRSCSRLMEGLQSVSFETKRDSQSRLFHADHRTAMCSPPPLNPLLPRASQQHCDRRCFQFAQQTRSMSGGCSQHFENESEYHSVADETLEDIQDAVEMALEDHDIGADAEDPPEVVYASGVLTLGLPPHGTWVLNKQTPNRQIWWSSPLSGPRRYEYHPESSEWVHTRSLEQGVLEETLTKAITEEFLEIYGIELDLE